MAKKKPKKSSGNALGFIVFCAVLYLLFHSHAHLGLPSTLSHVGGGTVATSGNYSCSQLETLWSNAGGTDPFLAAEIARAESSGNPTATDADSNGTVDYGLWQDNSSNGGGTQDFDPVANAQLAVHIWNERQASTGNGWSAWSTYNNGSYSGQC